MTRDDALLKLLALEPETETVLVQATGWGEGETRAVLNRLVEEGKASYTNRVNQHVRRYFVTQ
jgi:hypothetical protein